VSEAVMSKIYAVFIFVFGTVVGSFLNVCIWRIPREESLLKPGSHCPKCNTPIAWYDNIPIVSYLVLRGRCRHCGERISIRYAVVEALTGALFVCLYLKFGLTIAFAVYCALVASFIAVTFIDIDHYIIPNRITFGGIGVGLVLSFTAKYLPGDRFVVTNTVQALLGGVVFAGILYVLDQVSKLIFKKPGMGGGDVKLAAMIGLFVGLRLVLPVILVASVVGSVIGIGILIARRKEEPDPSHYIPFGPYLVLGTIIVLFFGENMWEYWRNMVTVVPTY
jgi:leader peptidase (prepilin peptidase)/N-methyltransferase